MTTEKVFLIPKEDYDIHSPKLIEVPDDDVINERAKTKDLLQRQNCSARNTPDDTLDEQDQLCPSQREFFFKKNLFELP